MALNPLQQLHEFGQSPWYDNISRHLLRSGGLQALINDGIRGMTSNPTIFQKAVAESDAYDAEIRELALAGRTTTEIYEKLITDDIRDAADILRPIYEQSNGADGYISIEVSPRLAHDTQGTIDEALRLRQIIQRDNVLIKVPATPAGIPAVEYLIGQGVNVNVTLIFALDAYRAVAEAFVAGVQTLAASGKPVDRVASVASFFVSRVDSVIDKKLDALQATAGPDQQEMLHGLHAQAAIANAKLAYEVFGQIFGSAPFTTLAQQGARPQRCLWASTGTKNPAYSDVLYVETLIGPETVNTMPPQTVTAWNDHGVPRRTLDTDVAAAHQALADLERLGIRMESVTDGLLADGVRLFAESFDVLEASISAKRESMLAGSAH